MTRCALIFVVDDEPYLLRSLVRHLEREELTFHVFTDPFEALRHVPILKPDALLTDYQMPQMSGLELCERIGESEDRPTLMLMSGALTVEAHARAAQLNVQHVFRKPIDLELLNGILCRIANAPRRNRPILGGDQVGAAEW